MFTVCVVKWRQAWRGFLAVAWMVNGPLGEHFAERNFSQRGVFQGAVHCLRDSQKTSLCLSLFHCMDSEHAETDGTDIVAAFSRARAERNFRKSGIGLPVPELAVGACWMEGLRGGSIPPCGLRVNVAAGLKPGVSL